MKICVNSFKATGRDVHGGYAEYTTVSEDFAHDIPGNFSDSQAAPLLCAGAIGYRSLRLTGIRGRLQPGVDRFWRFGPSGFKNHPA